MVSVRRPGETLTRAADEHASERAIKTMNNPGYRDHTKPVYQIKHTEIYGSGQIQNSANNVQSEK